MPLSQVLQLLAEGDDLVLEHLGAARPTLHGHDNGLVLLNHLLQHPHT